MAIQQEIAVQQDVLRSIPIQKTEPVAVSTTPYWNHQFVVLVEGKISITHESGWVAATTNYYVDTVDKVKIANEFVEGLKKNFPAYKNFVVTKIEVL